MGIKLKLKIEDVSDREALKPFFEQMKLKLVPLQTYKVYFVDEKEPRSIPMNNYYWGVVVKYVSDETGQDPQELHEYFKIEFNSKEMNIGGKNRTYGGSTTALNNQEFIEYFERIRLWASEFLGIIIPLPNEVPWENIIEGKIDSQP